MVGDRAFRSPAVARCSTSSGKPFEKNTISCIRKCYRTFRQQLWKSVQTKFLKAARAAMRAAGRTAGRPPKRTKKFLLRAFIPTQQKSVYPIVRRKVKHGDTIYCMFFYNKRKMAAICRFGSKSARFTLFCADCWKLFTIAPVWAQAADVNCLHAMKTLQENKRRQARPAVRQIEKAKKSKIKFN